jgi:hypothetical protein
VFVRVREVRLRAGALLTPPKFGLLRPSWGFRAHLAPGFVLRRTGTGSASPRAGGGIYVAHRLQFAARPGATSRVCGGFWGLPSEWFHCCAYRYEELRCSRAAGLYLPSVAPPPVLGNLAPLSGRLTVSPTPAKQICAQAAHYGTDHSSDNETPGVHRTSPPNYTFANETYLRHLNPYPYPRRPGDDNLAASHNLLVEALSVATFEGCGAFLLRLSLNTSVVLSSVLYVSKPALRP